jgi:hypothetical protein
MTENALILKQQLTPDTWRMIADIAPTMAQSRLFGVPSAEAAAAIMLKGFELGLSLTASFEFIHIIDGKPGLSPRGALALIQNDPNFGNLKVQDITDANGKPERCRVTMTRKSGYSYTVEFTMEDAARAELVKKGSGWEKYPANMLRWRAIGYCADVVFPDVIGGMKRVDELGAGVTPGGDFIVDVQPTEVQKLVIEQIPQYGITLPKLMELATEADILEAFNGAYPATPEQINQTVHKLIQDGKLELPHASETNA